DPHQLRGLLTAAVLAHEHVADGDPAVPQRASDLLRLLPSHLAELARGGAPGGGAVRVAALPPAVQVARGGEPQILTVLTHVGRAVTPIDDEPPGAERLD